MGVPDKVYGEEVMAFVIQKGRREVTAEELIQFTKERLSRHKAPRYVQFIDEYPMTASGKIQKYKLREMAISTLKAGRSGGDRNRLTWVRRAKPPNPHPNPSPISGEGILGMGLRPIPQQLG